MAGTGKDKQLCQKVAEIYDWLEEQITNMSGENNCRACGKCCDFENYDHRLFVTEPELVYLAYHIGRENIKPMLNGMCPFNVEGKCSVYDYRFASCRIFSCNGDADFQSELSEATLKRIKSLCGEFQIPYLYKELAFALND